MKKQCNMKTSLSCSELSFLVGYSPKDEHITSEQEVKTIIERLGLRFMTSIDLHSTRDLVVRFYSTMMKVAKEKDGCFSDKCMQYMTAKQSVTSVIDYVPYL